jgi:transcriptional regulator with XRE-family HTH domain
MVGELRPDVGSSLRCWRERRRVSQLAVAVETGISSRHVSFIETGRSRPGRDVVLRITKFLEVPLRERNGILLAAGFAPEYPELPLEDPELAPVREALNVILAAHEPYPALVVDRVWNIVAANGPMIMLGQGIDPGLLEPPVNAMRVGLHPKGLAPWIVNLTETRAYFLRRLERQVASTGDRVLAELLEEVSGYPSPGDGHIPVHSERPDGIVTPQIEVRLPGGGVLAFFATVLTFGTAAEVNVSELSIELAFPADAATAHLLATLVRQPL